MTDLTNQEKLEEVYHLVKENNNILRSLRRRENVATVFRIIYWLVILGALGGVYYFVNPFVSGVVNKKENAEKSLQQFDQLKKIIPEINSLQNAMSSLQTQKVTTDTATTVAQ